MTSAKLGYVLIH